MIGRNQWLTPTWQFLRSPAISEHDRTSERGGDAASSISAPIDFHYANTAAPYSAQVWVHDYRYVWASSPGWGAAWDSALAAHPPATEPDYEPGKDPAVITDGMILSTVQALGTP
jgi:hypothetical protein